MSEHDDRPRKNRTELAAEQLTDRFHRLPPVDPQRLRADIDATVDQRLPGTAPEKELRGASVKQARRLAAHRAALLQSGAYTVGELAADRGEDPADTRVWLARQLGDRRLFVVDHDGEQLVPAFQLTAAGEPRSELGPLIEVLADAGVRGWEAWTWLSSRTSSLSGDVPAEVAANDPARARRAVEQFAWSGVVAPGPGDALTALQGAHAGPGPSSDEARAAERAQDEETAARRRPKA